MRAKIERVDLASIRLKGNKEKLVLNRIDGTVDIAEEGQSSQRNETTEELVKKLLVLAEEERFLNARIEDLCIANKTKEKCRSWYHL